MTKKHYVTKIKKLCKDAGTYAPYYDSVISELAEILEIKDEAQKQYIDAGGVPIVTHINRAGAENVAKNPALVVILDCKAQALAYWRDLGLTPKGLKSLGENITKEEKQSFGDALASLGI